MKKSKISSKGDIASVQYKTGSFTDYIGQTHEFVVCAVAVVHDIDLILAEWIRHNGHTACLPVKGIDGDERLFASVYFGVSICNPTDTFNLERGKQIAYNKALSTKLRQRWVASDTGMIKQPEAIEVFLNLEVQFVASHPEEFIAGYAEAERKYYEKLEVQHEYAMLKPEAKTIVDKGLDGYDLERLSDIAERMQKLKDVPCQGSVLSRPIDG